MKKSLSVAAVLLAAGALTLGSASSAFAADAPVLPPTQALYNIDCESNAPQLWTFTTDGASTPVGAPGITADCAGGGQTNPVDGKTYFVLYDGESRFGTVDLVTGAVTVISQIHGDAPGVWQLIITNDGSAFITDDDNLYSLDLTTGDSVFIGNMAPFSPGAMGYDYTTDTIWAFDGSNTQGIYTIDRTTGAATDTGIGGNWPVGACLNGGSGLASPDGVAFDSNGIAWIQADSACDSLVMAFDPVSHASWITGELFDATATIYPAAPFDYYSETFLIASVVAPAAVVPALAATGTETIRTVELVGGLAAVAVLVGTLLIVRRRRALR